MRINENLKFDDFLYIIRNNTTLNSEVSYQPEEINTPGTTDDLLNMPELANLFEDTTETEKNVENDKNKNGSVKRVRRNTVEDLGRNLRNFAGFMKKKLTDKINKFNEKNDNDKKNDDEIKSIDFEDSDESNSSINASNGISKNNNVINNDNKEENNNEKEI